MTDAGWSLQKAIHATLVADQGVVAVLGGPKVYDHVPRKTEAPYITFGRSVVTDWSTGTEAGHEHLVTVHVWSTAAGRKEAAAILDAARVALHDRSLVLDGHQLVNLRQDFSDIRREPNGDMLHGILRLRAVTEPLAAAA